MCSALARLAGRFVGACGLLVDLSGTLVDGGCLFVALSRGASGSFSTDLSLRGPLCGTVGVFLGDGLSRFHLGTLGGRFVSSRGSAITCVFRHITTLAEESGTVDVSEPEDQLRRHAIRLLGAKD
ncbi:hypothetical protein MNVI_27700 [Mycobacterium noviomagense]|uniref:Uncharacterized protein n=1 Tax=Mycobacterium noviomagense TaxID=459858 RepID=A0A7I7PFZ8_9MYCO|nr:hypothetical protein MNVI_27700 [Mycobacterium noviomagense]